MVDGGRFQLWAFRVILLAFSMINMALKTSVGLKLLPIGFPCKMILKFVAVLSLIALLHTYNHFASPYFANS